MSKNVKTEKKSPVNMFFSGVAILTIASILVKSVGLISKIVLNTVVGSEGAGYYSTAYEIYAFLYVISTSGLPIAISIMISKCKARGKLKEAKKTYDVALIMFIIIGTILTSLMIIFSQNIAQFISAPDTTICIIAVAPTLLFICISSCLRGYFQGYQLMRPTAISQFIEAVCKVGVGVGFAIYAISMGYDTYTVAAFTILGVTVGVFLGMCYLYVRKLFFKEKQFYNHDLVESDKSEIKTKSIIKELISIAVPITISSSVLSLTTIIDTFMVQSRLLESGVGEDMVRVLYGDYTTLVISMINLPTILIYPIANALVPLISSAIAKNDLAGSDNMRAFSLRVINIISIPCALGLGIFSKPILDLLMFTESSVNRASSWLSIGAVSVVLLGLIASTNAFLNTAGKQKLPILSMLAGAIVKLISNYFLIGNLGIYGAPISTVLCYFTAASLNIFFTVKYVGKLPNVKKIFVLPLFCGVFSIGTSALIYLALDLIMPGKIATVICILLSVVIYLFMILRTKTVTNNEIKLLPHGEKIVKVFTKIGFLSKKC
ncbi:MAG: polysaccharide biosynthesis protein [Clostridia bacterium]|nr:polysaccharide biosynthesis protein [Clostridia bacterium]